jgi:hypothetical protein
MSEQNEKGGQHMVDDAPGRYHLVEVERRNLLEVLGNLKTDNAEDIQVTPYKMKVVDELFNATEFKVVSYLVIYYTPPVTGIPGLGGDGAPATMQ